MQPLSLGLLGDSGIIPGVPFSAIPCLCSLATLATLRVARVAREQKKGQPALRDPGAAPSNPRDKGCKGMLREERVAPESNREIRFGSKEAYQPKNGLILRIADPSIIGVKIIK